MKLGQADVLTGDIYCKITVSSGNLLLRVMISIEGRPSQFRIPQIAGAHGAGTKFLITKFLITKFLTHNIPNNIVPNNKVPK